MFIRITGIAVKSGILKPAGRGWAVARRGEGWRAGRLARLPLLLALLLPAARADVIFRVPEVLVRHAAAARPVGTGRLNGTVSDSGQWGSAGAAVEGSRPGEEAGLVEVRYEEYFVEHDVSTADARAAARKLNLDDIPSTQIGCGSCSRREMEYCETRVLADHCCCERRFLREPFPWLPHTCYLGPSRCRPLAHDCVQYVRLRDCCCYKQLAQRWKGILSRSSRAGVSGASLLLLSLLLLALRL
ncbi:unnamed protein product [Parnassius apollo]|uniref:(apollo) hypothetical protein n=1 Tax=Parnassius apollo TaxID=110799 RepID=A0A8S3VY58_PARAO|nr:unnamed protein product [Parnassius apollo]